MTDTISRVAGKVLTLADLERRVEVPWVRSSATHTVWCERRHATTPAEGGTTREVICVARIEDGAVVERWSFG